MLLSRVSGVCVGGSPLGCLFMVLVAGEGMGRQAGSSLV